METSMSKTTKTVCSLTCDGCGAVFSERAAFSEKYGDDWWPVVVAADRAKWQWYTGKGQETQHFCPGCVAAGKFEAFYEKARASYEAEKV
jgi:hypothetical protein